MVATTFSYKSVGVGVTVYRVNHNAAEQLVHNTNY